MLRYTIHIFFLWFLVNSTTAYSQPTTTKKVLMLHSYHQGLEWTDSISRGMLSVLGPRFYEIEIYYEYLDTKRNNSSEYWHNLINLFRAKNRNFEFDLIISADNLALEFLNLYGEELYPDVPIVFCGINGFHEGLISGIDQVTGVVEYVDYKATVELMLQTHPLANKILVIHDETDTGKAVSQALRKVETQYQNRIDFEFFDEFTEDELKMKVSSLGPESLVYLTALHRDKNNNFLNYRPIANLLKEHSTVPVYSSWDFYLGKGILGGVITSGEEQGQLAATLALSVLSGKKASDIPIQSDNPNKTYFDAQLFDQYGINKADLPPHILLLHDSEMATRPLRITTVWMIFILFSLSLILLIQFVLQKRKLERLILDSRASTATPPPPASSDLQTHSELFSDLYDPLDEVLNSLPTPVFYKDTYGIYVNCNDAFSTKILGLGRGEVIGRSLYGLPEQIPIELADIYNAKDMELLENPGTQIYSANVQCADGITRHYMMHKVTVDDPQGNLRGIAGVMLDISEETRVKKDNEEMIAQLEQANKRLASIVITDELTGLYNRRYIRRRLAEEVNKSSRYQNALSILILDIDNYTQVNETYGHRFGNRVLQKISQEIGQLIRKSDLLGRYDDDELLLVLPYTNVAMASILAERIREAVSAIKWEYSELIITVSGGIAGYQGEPDNKLLNIARDKLHRARSLGHNQIIAD